MTDLHEKVSDAVPFGPSVVSLVLLLVFYQLLCSCWVSPMTVLTPLTPHTTLSSLPVFTPGSHCFLGAAVSDHASASKRRVVCPMYAKCLDLLQKHF